MQPVPRSSYAPSSSAAERVRTAAHAAEDPNPRRTRKAAALRSADGSTPECRERQRRLVLVRERRAERRLGGLRTEAAAAEGSGGATSAVPARAVSPRELMRELGVVEVAERQRVVDHHVRDLRRDVA